MSIKKLSINMESTKSDAVHRNGVLVFGVNSFASPSEKLKSYSMSNFSFALFEDESCAIEFEDGLFFQFFPITDAVCISDVKAHSSSKYLRSTVPKKYEGHMNHLLSAKNTFSFYPSTGVSNPILCFSEKQSQSLYDTYKNPYVTISETEVCIESDCTIWRRLDSNDIIIPTIKLQRNLQWVDIVCPYEVKHEAKSILSPPDHTGRRYIKQQQIHELVHQKIPLSRGVSLHHLLPILSALSHYLKQLQSLHDELLIPEASITLNIALSDHFHGIEPLSSNGKLRQNLLKIYDLYDTISRVESLLLEFECVRLDLQGKSLTPEAAEEYINTIRRAPFSAYERWKDIPIYESQECLSTLRSSYNLKLATQRSVEYKLLDTPVYSFNQLFHTRSKDNVIIFYTSIDTSAIYIPCKDMMRNEYWFELHGKALRGECGELRRFLEKHEMTWSDTLRVQRHMKKRDDIVYMVMQENLSQESLLPLLAHYFPQSDADSFYKACNALKVLPAICDEEGSRFYKSRQFTITRLSNEELEWGNSEKNQSVQWIKNSLRRVYYVGDAIKSHEDVLSADVRKSASQKGVFLCTVPIPNHVASVIACDSMSTGTCFICGESSSLPLNDTPFTCDDQKNTLLASPVLSGYVRAQSLTHSTTLSFSSLLCPECQSPTIFFNHGSIACISGQETAFPTVNFTLREFNINNMNILFEFNSSSPIHEVEIIRKVIAYYKKHSETEDNIRDKLTLIREGYITPIGLSAFLNAIWVDGIQYLLQQLLHWSIMRVEATPQFIQKREIDIMKAMGNIEYLQYQIDITLASIPT